MKGHGPAQLELGSWGKWIQEIELKGFQRWKRSSWSCKLYLALSLPPVWDSLRGSSIASSLQSFGCSRELKKHLEKAKVALSTTRKMPKSILVLFIPQGYY